MDVTPFDFKTRDIDSAIRFGYFSIQDAKEALKEVKEFKFDRAIRLFRVIGRKLLDYSYIRQTMDEGRQEENLLKDLGGISKDCQKALGLMKKRMPPEEKQKLVERILMDLISFEVRIEKILARYEKKVAKGEGLYAGVDGGGTKTIAVISKADGTVLGIGGGEGLPCDPGRVKTMVSFNSLITALKQACEKAGINFKTAKFNRICAGFVIRNKEIHRRAEQLMTTYMYKFMKGHVKDVIFLPDHVVSWYAATKGLPGIVLLGGTGHIVYGNNPLNKKEAVCFTYEKDQNLFSTVRDVHLSGRFVAYHTVKALVRSGRRKSILRNEVEEAFERGLLWKAHKARGHKLDELLKDTYKFFEIGSPSAAAAVGILEVNDVPELARFAIIAAEKGDPMAISILANGAHTMARYISHIAEDIGLHNKRFIIGITGSVALHEISRMHLRKQIKLFEPAVQPQDIVLSDEPAQITALKIAIENKRFY